MSRPLGALLLAAFERVAVISLPRSADRRAAVTHMLLRELGLGVDSISFPPAVDCAAWGRWPEAAVARHGGANSSSTWWLHSLPCKKTAERHQMAAAGGCLRTEFDACRRVARSPAGQSLDEGLRGDAVRLCGGVCYTLSVAAALRDFLVGNGTRMLLLEDDSCATEHLLRRSGDLLGKLAQGRNQWAIARIGHCFDRRAGRGAVCLGNRSVEDAERSVPVELLPGIGRSFCAHALGVTREGAERLLRLAFPVSAYFDDMLYALAGGYGESAQQVALERAGVRSAAELRAFHSSSSLFGQHSKDGGVSTLIHLSRPEREAEPAP
mmetsp:Transcript_13268/g.39164  ORF Transcript_13268/g.39164 Transcript_13268/m.39164 type:complete len:324 (+) Transcript_13268:110-1081(+)|eukprot:3690279-Prymnesium_polylepis.1